MECTDRTFSGGAIMQQDPTSRRGRAASALEQTSFCSMCGSELRDFLVGPSVKPLGHAAQAFDFQRKSAAGSPIPTNSLLCP